MHDLIRTVLVTGASSGIGRAIAKNLLLHGHRVIGVSRNSSRFTRQHPGFTPVQMDLSDLVDMPEQIGGILRRFPELNTAIFAAGLGQFASLEEFSYAQIERLITINFTSQAILTRALLPHFKRNKPSNLIYIGSEAALKGSRKGTVYCASKFALRGFSQALREESAKSGVRVCLINPGMVKTEFFESLSFTPGDDATHHLMPEDVAEAVSYVLNSRNTLSVDEINLNPLNRVIKFKKTE